MNTTLNSRQIARMASRGRYVEADDAQQRKKELKRAQVAALRQQLDESQAAEWLAFSRAAREHVAAEEAALVTRQQQQMALIERHVAAAREGHDEELEAFALREQTLLQRRPVAHSQRYVEAKWAEGQLAQQGCYHAASTLRDQAARIASEECRAAEAETQRRLGEKIQKWELDYGVKERNAVRSLHAKGLLQEARAQRQARATHARLSRMQRDMAAMHERQHGELDSLGQVRTGCGAPLCTATRGTRLEHSTITAQQTLPSLCGLYGDLLV